MKRFFTKKSVALILTTIVLVGLFYFNNALALGGMDSVNPATDPTTKLVAAAPDIAPVLWSGFAGLANYGAGIAAAATTGPIIAFLGVVLAVQAFLTAFAGMLFDLSVYFLIYGMKTFFDIAAITSIWTLLRDLLNISFIFILLYSAITIIIGTAGTKAKTIIVNVIISAVLINFSMFITKILIDVGNIAASALYQQIQTMGGGQSLSTLFLNSFQLTSFVKSAFSLTGQVNMIISILLQIGLAFILMYVFFMGAFMLTGRLVMLILLAVISPLGFVGDVIPWLKKFRDGWWESLINQILVAPALMFLLLLTTKLLENTYVQQTITATKNSWTEAGLSAPALDVSSFFFYSIIIYLLLKGMKYIKQLSGEVAGTIVKVAGAVALGTAAVVTGGAAIGAGALGSGAAAAGEAAGGSVASKWATRLAFSAKNMGTQIGGAAGKIGEVRDIAVKATPFGVPVGEFATGALGEKPGAVGLAARFAREKIVGGIKEGTGGTVDIKAFEKYIKEERKAEEKRIEEQAGKLSGKKETDELKQLKSTKENITAQAAKKLKVEIPAKEDEQKKAIKDLEDEKGKAKEKQNEAEKTLVEKTKAFEQSKKNQEGKNPLSQVGIAAQKEYAAAEKEYKTATENKTKAVVDFSKAEQKVKNFETNMKKVAEEAENVAKSMGTSMGTIKDRENVLNKKVEEGAIERNKFIKEVSEGNLASSMLSSVIFGAGANKAMAAKLRAAESKDLNKAFQKMMKEYNIKPEEEEKKEEPKKEEKKEEDKK